ncbi:hypothetical protein [Moorena sp. SIO3A2]|nr:hypothetical protein [Moorena sp. SIO3A2]
MASPPLTHPTSNSNLTDSSLAGGQCSRFPIPDSRFPIPHTPHPTPHTLLPLVVRYGAGSLNTGARC